MKYPDTVQLAITTTDGYGDKHVTTLTTCKANFIQRTSIGHDNNTDVILSNAAVYLDPTNAVVTANLYRLEGLYIIANPLIASLYGDNTYGQGPYSQPHSWYRVAGVTVGQRKLLNNAIDNIYCTLQKEAGLPYVAYVS